MRSVPACDVQKVLKIGIPLLIFCLLIAPAAAVVESHVRDTYTFSATAPEDKMIDSFRVDDLEPSSTQQFVLNAYGDYYTVVLNSTKNWGSWDFNATCTYPNGTVQYEQFSKWAPLSNSYDILFQAYWFETGWMWETQLFLTLSPITVSEAIIESETISFYEVSGSSTCLMNDVTVYFVTAEEFEAHRQLDPITGAVEGVKSTAGYLGEAAWLAALAGTENIPGIGPYVSAGLSISGMVIGEVFWWLKFLFIDNGPLTFLTIEFFIMGEAMMASRTLVQMLKKVLRNHIKVYEFFLKIATWAISTMISIIQAIGSLLPFT